jgi:Rhodanese-like domain
MAKSRPTPGTPKKASSATSTLVLVIGAILVIALVAFSLSRTMQNPASPTPAASVSQSSGRPPVPKATSDPQGSPAAPTFPPSASPRDEVVPATSQAIPGPADAAPTQAQLVSVPRIEAADLLQKLENKQVTLIDVRDVDSYRTRHIPGAMQIPLSFIAGEVPYLPKDKPIVTYCT